MIRIEFIGIPGVGKSTVRKEIVNFLKKYDKDKFLLIEEAFLKIAKERIDWPYRLILKSLPQFLAMKISNKLTNRSLMQYEYQNYFIAKWGGSLNSFLESPKYKELSIIDRKIVISGYLHIGSLYQATDTQLLNDKVIFFEEGFVQKSFMFISQNKKFEEDNKYLQNYLNQVPLPDFVIYLTADYEVCYDRMKNRKYGFTERLKNSEKGAIIKFIEISDCHIKNVISILESSSDVEITAVRNDINLETVASFLGKKILKYVNFYY